MRSQNPSGGARPALWAVLFPLLSAAPVLKIADIQAVEWLQLAWLCCAAPVFVYRGMSVPCSQYWWRYRGGYAIFLLASIALAGLSLRLDLYPPPDISVLKQPFILSLSRIFELFLGAFFMLKLAEEMSANSRTLRLALNAYIAVGILSALVSIVGWVAVRITGVSFFAVYGYEDRVRGFFNEGGPYGIFLVSVALALILKKRTFGVASFPFLNSMALALLLIALLLSGSKAGLLVAIGLLGLGLLFAGNKRQKLGLLAGGALIVAVLVTLFQGKLLGYAYAYMDLDEAIAYRPNDPSLIMGRIAAASIVPKMISAHPVLGIGPGNYSLMRNDPEYLQGLPPVDDWDLPGMGLFGATAEFGIPLTLFLAFLLIRPLMTALQQRAPAAIAVAAGFQPLAFLFGVNLNFFYPWLMAGFVIAFETPSRGARI